MKIVLLDALAFGDSDLSVFEKLGEFKAYEQTLPEETITHVGDSDVIITNKVFIGKATMAANPKLKLICIAATGKNNVDLVAAEAAGIPVKNVSGYSTESVAQSTIAMLLSLVQKTRYYDNYTQSKSWCDSPTFTHIAQPFDELKGKRWGIIGYGAIGQRVGEIAQVFGCKLCYHSTSGKNSQQAIEQLDLVTLLSTCDIISIHAPLNEQTENLIDAVALKQLKKGAIILNLGRGGIIDEEAMAEALDQYDFYHGTDVLAVEPMLKDHPYFSIKDKSRLLITPHTAWASTQARALLIQKIMANIESTDLS